MEKKNPMQEIKIEKVVLSIGGTGEYLERGHKLLKYLTNGKPTKTKSRKRIPSLGKSFTFLIDPSISKL